MNDYFNLLNRIAQEYNIQQGNQESEIEWKTRVIYSFLGQTGYASLFDVQENLDPVSITHFKQRIKTTLSHLLAMYPELKGYFTEAEALAEEIYQVFCLTGCIYHEQYRLSPCLRSSIQIGNRSFLRGQALEEKKWLSGIGCYYPNREQAEDTDGIHSLLDMFMILRRTLPEVWKDVIASASFRSLNEEVDLEFLRTIPPFKSGYWLNRAEDSGQISLARTKTEGEHIYYLYRMDGGKLSVSQLPNWMTEGYEYRRIAVACLYSRGTLPETEIKTDGSIAIIKIGYLYPPAELNLLKLYSWPDGFSVFSRIIDVGIINDIRLAFETLGYSFKEA